MQLFSVIFFFEWRQLLRQPAQLLILAFFLLSGLFSIYNGHSFIGRQLKATDSLRQIQRANFKDATGRFHADTSTATGKMLFSQAGIPQVVEFRNPAYAIDVPTSLAMLSIGQRDLLPYFDLVNTKRNYSTPPDAEIANPEKLASGNFDLSFVLVYLFPLLIIVWCYNILSQEKEQQTDRLLAVQGASIPTIIICKLLFRLTIVLALALVLSIIGFINHPVSVELYVTDALVWVLLVVVYIGFWFAVCRLVINFNYSSARNILILPGIWLVFTLLIPAFANKFTELAYPMPSRATLASEQREITNETWEMPRPALIDTFYKNNPQYLKLKQASDTAQYGNKRFAAYEDLLQRRIKTSAAKYYDQADQHNGVLARLNWFNPIAQMQYLLNANAETGLQDHLSFEQQVNNFQIRWISFMNSYLLLNKSIKEAELKQLPQFYKQSDRSKTQHLLISSASIWLAIFMILLITPKPKTNN
jgi:ABC-2 type transport system permease protein